MSTLLTIMEICKDICKAFSWIDTYHVHNVFKYYKSTHYEKWDIAFYVTKMTIRNG